MFSTKLLFAVLFVLYYCTTVSTDSQYYVVAENTTDCQPADGECHPLSFYVTRSSSYFTNNNTIFYFKNGTHTLTDGINITGVHNVSFIGLCHLAWAHQRSRQGFKSDTVHCGFSYSTVVLVITLWF